MYPNKKLVIDSGLYIFEFSSKNKAEFIIVYHACHPVTRIYNNLISSDYIGQIRKAIRERFKVDMSFFISVCWRYKAKFFKKACFMASAQPINWHFDHNKDASELLADKAYQEGVHRAKQTASIELINNPVQFDKINLSLLAQGNFDIPRITIGKTLSFEFIPFEVSHYFHLDAQKKIKCAS